VPDSTLSASDPPEADSPTEPSGAPVRRASAYGRARRLLLSAALGAGMFAILFRLAAVHALSSDGANNALQGWDMVHGNVLLSGWVIGDATYYTLELPIFAVVERVMGLVPDVVKVEDALTFLLVLGLAMALARGRSTGMHALLRRLAVLAVLMAPMAAPPGELIMLSVPIHFGTGAFMLLAFLIYDRAPWGFAAPVLLCLVLALGQLGDATVLYCGVLPVVLVGCYRLLFPSRVWSRDGLFVVAAAVSVPLEGWVHGLIRGHGGYTMIKPKTDILPADQWPGNLRIAAYDVAQLFGFTSPGPDPGVLWFVRTCTGMLALAAVVCGALAVLLRWHRADPCEQLTLLAVALNVAGFAVTANASTGSAYDLCFALSGGSVLAARLVTPRVAERLAGRARRDEPGRPGAAGASLRWAMPAVALAAVAAFAVALGLSLPPQPSTVPALASFLEDHGLRYGLSEYQDASSVTLQSQGVVRVRAVVPTPDGFDAYQWETKQSWFDQAAHTADFFIASDNRPIGRGIPVAAVEARYGRPDRVYRAAGRVILVYGFNLLDKVVPPAPGEG
jgi:hypothetical protein